MRSRHNFKNEDLGDDQMKAVRYGKKWAVYKNGKNNEKGIGMALIVAETFEDALFAATIFFQEILPDGFTIEPAPRGFIKRQTFKKKEGDKGRVFFNGF